jgi:hypothetical protein
MQEAVAKAHFIQAYTDTLKVISLVICGLARTGLLLSLVIRGDLLDQFVMPPQDVAAQKTATSDEEKNKDAGGTS